MSDSKRTVDLIWSEMEALASDPDFDPAKYAELEAERNTVLARGQATQRHGTYSQVAPGQITATPKGDDGHMYAFAQYLRTGQPNHDLTFAQTEGTPSAGGYGVPDGYGYIVPSRIRSFQIPSESMVPNLLVGDRVPVRDE